MGIDYFLCESCNCILNDSIGNYKRCCECDNIFCDGCAVDHGKELKGDERDEDNDETWKCFDCLHEEDPKKYKRSIVDDQDIIIYLFKLVNARRKKKIKYEDIIEHLRTKK